MKKIVYFMTLGIFVSLSFVSCLKEDNVQAPTVTEVQMYMADKDGQDSLISEPVKGKAMKFVVITKADICTVWPGGNRDVVKKKVSPDGGVTFPDSIDMFNHPVLNVSDVYADYGLVGAKGFKTTQGEGGWYCTYTYKESGIYDLTIIVTNHGYDGPAYEQVVVDGGKITVR